MIAEASGSITNILLVSAWTSKKFVSVCAAAGKASGAYTLPAHRFVNGLHQPPVMRTGG